jgi:protein-arginine kinase activator protein McsA
MKFCSRCKTYKLLLEFNKNKNKKDGLQNNCKECCILNNKNFYNNLSKERKLSRVFKNNLNRYRNQQFVWNYLLKHSCIDCGESNPIVLEFDHIKGIKLHNLSNMILKMYSLDSIKKEIDKCEVRCANCHRIKTAIKFNWYKHILT